MEKYPWTAQLRRPVKITVVNELQRMLDMIGPRKQQDFRNGSQMTGVGIVKQDTTFSKQHPWNRDCEAQTGPSSTRKGQRHFWMTQMKGSIFLISHSLHGTLLFEFDLENTRILHLSTVKQTPLYLYWRIIFYKAEETIDLYHLSLEVPREINLGIGEE